MGIRLTFLGAARNVTGSRFLLEVNGKKILVDCGLYQERDFRLRNWNPCHVPPSEIHAVCLTHAHLDHCGWLPRLVKEGFQGKIYCTAATAEIARIVLLDSAKLQIEDAEYKQKRHKREGRSGPYPYQPLYNTEDAEAVRALFKPVQYKQTTEIVDGIQADFHDAGHILGASMIRMAVENNGQTRTILFSGDVGRSDKPILQDPTLFEQADYVLIESTYGDRLHEPTEDITAHLAKIINATFQAGGNIVVPSFSVERSQELLYYLNELLMAKRIPPLLAFLDSPMAIRVTEVFENHPDILDKETTDLIRRNHSPFDFPGLNLTRSTQSSKAINNIKGTVIIIAGSGMCTGGRIKHHLVNNIGRPESTILFVGYQARGTLGRTILTQPDEVRILGQPYKVRAQIVRVHGFSGHADRNELLRWLKALKQPPKTVFVVHGEPEAADSFAAYTREQLGWNAAVPEYLQTVQLD